MKLISNKNTIIFSLVFTLLFCMWVGPISAQAAEQVVPEAAYEALLNNDFSHFAGVWTNAKGRSFTLSKNGDIIEKGYDVASYAGTVYKENDYYSWGANFPAPDFGGFRVSLYPIGVADNWGLGSDASQIRILAGQSVPSSKDEFYYLTEPVNTPVSTVTLKEIIVGEWSYLKATDTNGNRDYFFDEYYMGTRLRGIDVRFDADGKFYQRHLYNSTGLEADSGADEWKYEGTYSVDGNNIVFKLADSENHYILFWRDGQTESGKYQPTQELLQYQTQYQDSAQKGQKLNVLLKKKITLPEPSLTATPTASVTLINGKNVSFDAYNIGGNNYFKLRDLAYTLSGTKKQFEVSWDGVHNAISLSSGKAYTVVGGEMSSKGSRTKTPVATASTIYLDGKEVSLTAYTIDGNNYFKLRDIGEAFDFGVDWDGVNNTIVIDTSKDYTAK